MFEKIRKRGGLWACVGIALTSFFAHTLPFLLYGNHPLGYDTGFYRRYLTQPFHSFPNDVVPGLGYDALVPRMFLDLLRVLHLPPDFILYGSYAVFFTIIPVLVFFLLRPSLGVRGAFFGGAILALSPVFYTTYWFMLFKNGLALCLMLGALIALERRAFFPVLFLGMGVALSHKTTAIVYILTLILLFCLQRKNWKEYTAHLSVVGLAFLTVNMSLPVEVSRALPSAVFLGWAEYVTLSIPLIVAAGIGFFLWKKTGLPKTIIAFTIVSLAFPIFQLPFYERIFVFADVALALLAAYGIEFLFLRIKNERWNFFPPRSVIFLLIFFGLLLGNLQNQIKTLKPLISVPEILHIERIGELVPETSTILTTTNEAPWFQGFTHSHIAAPGMLYDNHNLEQWTEFWNSTSTEMRMRFLNEFPQPLYIASLGNITELIGTPLPCLKEITPELFKNECVK